MSTATAAVTAADPPPKKVKPLKKPFVDRVTVQVFIGQKDLSHLKPIPGIGAHHQTLAGKDCIVLDGRDFLASVPVRAKSVITDSAGITWTVTADTRRQTGEIGTLFVCPVVKAAAPAGKPDKTPAKK